MATTRDYIDYLNDQVDIAPTNSQEELQAAQLIQQIMDQHGVETKLQEFEAPTAGNLPYRVLMILLFIGIVREIIGFGTIFGVSLGENFQTISIIGLAPGGFFVYGCIIALLNKLTKGKGVKRKSFDCESCPSAATCSGAKEGGCEA